MIHKKIIIVDDEENIRSLVIDYLEDKGFVVIGCENTDDGYKRIVKSKPDLAILDLKMPTIGGVELCRMLRQNEDTKNIPIIMLTVESSETDKVMGLEIGADDYVVKPFSLKELLARIKALLRRVEGMQSKQKTLKNDELEINIESHTVTITNKVVELRPKEFDLLVLFLQKPNILLDRSYILENIFGYKVPVSTRTIDTHIKNLRQALGPKYGDKITTVFSMGFKFMP